MKKPGVLKFFGRALGLILLIEAVLVGLILFLGWRLEWESAAQYHSALETTGMLAIGFGLFGIKGNWDATRSFGYQYSLSTTAQSSWERTQLSLFDFLQAFQFLLVMFAVGGVNLLLGWLL